MSNRFNPRPGMIYAACDDCGLVLNDRAAVDAHMSETREASEARKSHGVVIHNPTREERIRYWVQEVLEPFAIAFPTLTRAIDRNEVTQDEVTKAIGDLWPIEPLTDLWAEYIESEAC